MKNLFTALVKFQSQLKPTIKDSQNPFFKSTYADLSSILQNVMPVLTANGLSVIQPMRIDDGITILTTKLLHESGESIDSEMVLPHNPDPQKYGSLITYYKRYQLQALLGISTADEDDDANLVSQSKPQQRQAPQAQPRTSSPPTEGQLKAMWAISKKLGIEAPKVQSFDEASEFIKRNSK